VLAVGAVLAACSESNHPSRSVLGEESGIELVADPAEVVIDLTDPNTPIDPDSGKAFGETALSALVTDSLGAPEVGVEVVFSSNGGTLSSEGQPVLTNDQGLATDTLRILEDDPDEILVTATVGERVQTATVTKVVILPNEPPVADAGADQTVECASAVTLDGSASTDPDSTEGTNDDITSFEWFLDFGTPDETLLGEGQTLDATLALGTHVLTLRVTDSEGETDTDEVTIEVADTTPPEVSVSTDPSVLWPPNHRLVPVDVTVDTADACGDTTVNLVSVSSSEPDEGTGDGNTVGDIQGVEPGTDDRQLLLRAERAGGGDGRTYTLFYTVTDESGNAAESSAEIRVPHDRGHGD
jgi:hypothetical protein